MRRARIPHAALLALALALAAPPALAGSFTETFDTKQFCDQTLTTALWDTIAGEVRLPPFDMDEIGGLAIPGVTRDVQVVGNVAYVANSMFGLMILDVSDPESPSLLGIADPSFDGYAVAVEGNLAYVAAGPDGLQVLDVSDPNLPVVVG
ncbi:hypothetical protein H8E07_16680, partial [bacterium]|nr:hypothetical protein [bacterium]